ncbi:MAG: response regulator transcription factor [Rikenellaceae bacterium]
MAKRIHIVIADPSTIIRSGITSILQQIDGINIDIAEISEVSTLQSPQTYRQVPDMLIVNPAHLGIFSVQQLKEGAGNQELKLVALQSSFTESTTLQNYEVVISIFDSTETIKEKISRVVDSDSESIDDKKELSVREKEIVVCVVKGLTNKQIADQLCLSTHTVIAHRRNIASKLQIHSPAGLTIYAIVNKLVDLADIKNSISQNKEEEI